MKELLNEVIKNNLHWGNEGRVAAHIPALAAADCSKLAISAALADGQVISAGDYQTKFTLQSISKPIALILALMDCGPEKVFSKVGMEPTGDPFNSIVKLEMLKPGKPLNPMINAGAIATTAQIEGDGDKKVERILKLVQLLAENDTISINEEVYQSEKETADRNRAIAYFMRETGVLEGDVEEILDAYFRQCAIEVTTADIAKIACFLALNGRRSAYGQLIPAEIIRIVNTFMFTCGMYNASGEFAVKVGIPAKSGVSGGIMAPVPGKLGLGVYGPALDNKGNSIGGIHVLADLVRQMKLSIF